jgi:beta-glucanase (GH16 family)
MRTLSLTALVLASLVASAQTTTGWKLVWSDEFNGPAGASPDPANWNYDLGNNNGWGNGEAEVYTNSTANVFQDGNGNLVIRAIRDAAGKYTSARLQTGSPGASTQTTNLSWQYGRIVARIKLPFGKGVWPAFWMLGENINSVGWPTCGEVDIMENFGTFNNNVSTNNGTAHGPGYSGGNGIGKSYTLPFGEKVADDYHVYVIEWSQDSIEFFVDGASYHKVTPASLPAGRQWVFNNPFFILLNLAIGGPNTGSQRAISKPGHAGRLRAGLPVNHDFSEHAGYHTRSSCERSFLSGHPRSRQPGDGVRQQLCRRTAGGLGLWRLPHVCGRCHCQRRRRERAAHLRLCDADQFSGAMGDRSRDGGERQGHARQRRQQCRADHHRVDDVTFGVPERVYKRCRMGDRPGM